VRYSQVAGRAELVTVEAAARRPTQRQPTRRHPHIPSPRIKAPVQPALAPRPPTLRLPILRPEGQELDLRRLTVARGRDSHFFGANHVDN